MQGPNRLYNGSMRSGLFTAITIALLLPVVAGAQSLESMNSSQPFTVSVSPQFPTPLSQATLSFLSSSLELNNSIVTVSVDGKEIYTGSARPVSLTLGKTGSVTNVTVKVVTNGQTYTQKVSLQPQDISLVVEPVSSSPPLYQGKSFVPLEGDVRVVAMANMKSSNGRAVDPSQLAYTWKVDAATLASASGIGKKALLVASPLQYRSRSVSVSVMSQDGALVGGAEVALTALEPSIRIYENDPLLGLRYERAISGSFNILDAESSLYAAPFSLPTTGGAPFIQWFLDGNSVQTGNSITLRPTGSGEGTASLSLTASTGESGSTSAILSLIFGTKPSFNLFGL